MKRIFSILTSVSFLLLIGCQKGDIAGDFAAQEVGSYLTRVAIGNGIIDYTNLANSKVDVTVKEYGTPIEKIKIFVTKGAANSNTTLWKAIKEIPYSGDTKLEVSATEIATALGIPVTGLETGQTYTLYNQIHTKSGGKWDISNTGGQYYGNPNYNMLMTWNAVVVCPFVATQIGAIGSTVNFRVLQDDWADWSPGQILPVVVASATSLRFPKMWDTSPIDTKPVTININATTGAATVPVTNYGSYFIYGPNYDDVSLQSSGTNNWVFSCQGTITLTLRHFKGTLNHGTYLFRLQKQ